MMSDIRCAKCDRKMGAHDIEKGWCPLGDRVYCRECVKKGMRKITLSLKALKIFGRN